MKSSCNRLMIGIREMLRFEFEENRKKKKKEEEYQRRVKISGVENGVYAAIAKRNGVHSRGRWWQR